MKPRTKVFQLKVNEDELRLLKKMAEKHGRTASEHVRELMRLDAKKNGLTK
jgi:hypothetical protein